MMVKYLGHPSCRYLYFVRVFVFRFNYFPYEIVHDVSLWKRPPSFGLLSLDPPIGLVVGFLIQPRGTQIVSFSI